MELKYSDRVKYYNGIIDILERKGTLSFNKLYQNWKKDLAKTPSKSTFSSLLREMVNNSYVKKSVEDRSNLKIKMEYYELTNEARKMLQLNVLRMGDKQEIFKKIYEKILMMPDFFDKLYRKILEDDPHDELLEKVPMSDRNAKHILINSELEFESYLSKMSINPDELEWGSVSDSRTAKNIWEILYPGKWSTSGKLEVELRIKKELQKLRDQSKSFSSQQIATMSEPQLTRAAEQLRSLTEQMKSLLQEYDEVDSSQDKYLEYLKADYWKGKNNQTRARERLLMICYPNKESEEELDFWMTRIEEWDIRKRKRNDLKANLVSSSYNIFVPGITIHDLLEDSRFEEAEIIEAIEILKNAGLIKPKLFSNETRYVIADSYLHDLISFTKSAFIDELYYLLYKWRYFENPTDAERERMKWLFGKKFNQILQQLEIQLHEYKVKMKSCANFKEYYEMFEERPIINYPSILLQMQETAKKPTGRKAKAEDIKNYHELRSKDLQNYIEKLTVQDEEMKMRFANIIKQYNFLHDIIGILRPKVFEPADFELRDEIIRDAKLKDDAKVESIKKLMPYVTDCGGVIIGSKKRKKVDYSTKMVEDSRTGNITRITYVE